MNKVNASMVVAGTLLLCACASLPEQACTDPECRELGGSDRQLTIWWTPDLREGAGDYSTVSLDE